MSEESPVEQKKDYYEAALQLGETLDLSGTCDEAMRVCALGHDAPLITLEVLDEESKKALGSQTPLRNEMATKL